MLSNLLDPCRSIFRDSIAQPAPPPPPRPPPSTAEAKKNKVWCQLHISVGRQIRGQMSCYFPELMQNKLNTFVFINRAFPHTHVFCWLIEY